MSIFSVHYHCRLLVLLVKENYSRLDLDDKSATLAAERKYPLPGQQTSIQEHQTTEYSPLLRARQF